MHVIYNAISGGNSVTRVTEGKGRADNPEMQGPTGLAAPKESQEKTELPVSVTRFVMGGDCLRVQPIFRMISTTLA